MPVELPEDQRFEIGASSRRVESAQQNHRHSHAFFELLYVIEGCSKVEIRDTNVEARAGDLLIVYPDEDHLETIQPGTFSIIWLRFAPDVIELPDGFPSQSETDPVVRLPWPERFQGLFEQMITEQTLDDAWHDTMSGAYLVQFVVLLRRGLAHTARASTSHAADRSMLIENTVALIHSSLGENLSLGELASRAYMSESHFSHTFKDATGLSPKKYQIRAKMLKAQEMLGEGDRSVKEVAASLGYDDPHYFSRLYKKVIGASPSASRSEKQKKPPL